MMSLTTREIESLKPYVKNARTHSDEQVAQLVNSIREFGFNNPIIVDSENNVIAGHGRLLAAKQLGLSSVPTITLGHLTDAQKRAYILADNKLALNAGWSLDLLKTEFESLVADGFDLALTGFAQDELQSIMFPDVLNVGETDPDSVPELKDNAVTRPGDVWLMGEHRLMCGDSTNTISVDNLYQNLKPLIMVTDPPYGVLLDQTWRDNAVKNKLGAGNINLVDNDNRADWRDAYSLFTGSIAYVWHASKFTDVVKKNLEECDFDVRQMIIWNKTQMVLSRSAYHWKHEPCWYAVRKGFNANWQGDRTQTTVWDAQSPNQIFGKKLEDKTEHPTQKPASIFEIAIKNHTTNSDIVYDPFCGSGTSIIAAERLGRRCYAMELSPHYCDVIVKRWQKFANNTAFLEGTNYSFDEVAKDGSFSGATRETD